MLFVLKGAQRQLDSETVRRAANQNVPDSTDGRHKYYVEVEGQRYPVKQLFALATGLHLNEFITDDATRLLGKLGFAIKDYKKPSVTNLMATDENSPSNEQVNGTDKPINFAVSLEPDEDGYIVASCPQLPGCHSQGRSRQEALKNIEEAIRGYMASMKHHGEEIPNIEWDLVKVRV